VVASLVGRLVVLLVGENKYYPCKVDGTTPIKIETTEIIDGMVRDTHHGCYHQTLRHSFAKQVAVS